MTLENEILAKIVPTPEDRKHIDGVADRLKNMIQAYMDEHRIVAELKLVGSYAKDTYLSNPDLDLFVMFPMGTPREELVDVGLRIGDEVLHGSRMYAEHPYTSAVFEGVDVDLVPNIHIDSTEKLETAVDRTPFHADYVLRKLQTGQNDQIRLLKKFMKGVGTYGAEPNVRGFSGYMCELLVLKYGTFQGVLLAAAQSWKEGMHLQLEPNHVEIEGTMVFYDPVDGRRNVASAVHVDTLCRFIAASKAYLLSPSERFFFPNKRTPLDVSKMERTLDKRDFCLISVIFDRPDIVADNIYAQLWKSYYAIAAKLDRFGFGVLRGTQKATEDKMMLAFILLTDELPQVEKRIGPEAWGKNAERFIGKWEGNAYVRPFIENGKWCAIVPRQYSSAAVMLYHEMGQAGVGKEIDITTVEILGHDDTLRCLDKDLLTELIDPKYPWEITD